MAKILKAPQTPEVKDFLYPWIFLGGSIEMGVAENWQVRLEEKLKAYDVVVCNPRRDDWDSNWAQEKTNPQFNEQVTWELGMQEEADLLIYYFSPGTQSPITLLELGLFSEAEDVFVCCPEGFWRKGNIDIVCERYEIPQFNTLDELIHEVEMWCINRI